MNKNNNIDEQHYTTEKKQINEQQHTTEKKIY